MTAAARQAREGLRSANKFCDMFGCLAIEDDDDHDYSVPKG